MSQCLDVLLADAEQRYTDAARAFSALTSAIKQQRALRAGDPDAVARDHRRRDVLSTPAVVSEWLHDECRRFDKPLRSDASARETARINVPQLVAYAFAAPTPEARAAALEHLRGAFSTAFKQLIDSDDEPYGGTK